LTIDDPKNGRVRAVLRGNGRMSAQRPTAATSLLASRGYGVLPASALTGRREGTRRLGCCLCRFDINNL